MLHVYSGSAVSSFNVVVLLLLLFAASAVSRSGIQSSSVFLCRGSQDNATMGSGHQTC